MSQRNERSKPLGLGGDDRLADPSRRPPSAGLLVLEARGGMARGLGVQVLCLVETALRDGLLLGEPGDCQ